MRMRDSYRWKLYIVFFIMHFQNASLFFLDQNVYVLNE